MLAWGLGLAFLAAPVEAQTSPAEVADLPPGPAVIRGTVLRLADSAPIANAEVLLYALSQSGEPGIRRATTDVRGAFVFEGISNDPHTAYLLGARYRGIPFPGERVVFAANETEHEVEIRISEPVADASRLEVLEATLRFERAGSSVAVTETYRLRQPEGATAYVPPESRRPEQAGLRVRLPAGSEDFAMPFGVIPEGVVQEDDRVLFYGPFYPGEQDLRLSYRIPVSGETVPLRKLFASGAGAVKVQAPAQDLEVQAPGLTEAEETEIHGRRYRQLVGEALAPGAALGLTLRLPPLSHDPGALELTETRIFIDLDGSAAVVREEHHVRVTASSPVAAEGDEGLLDIPLPPNSDTVRFPRETLQMGLTSGGDDVARLRGPVPPGESLVDVLYRIPVNDDGTVALERRFGKPLPLLSVFVADTGVLVESERLHRRRPARTPDRTYLHLEAFDVQPDEAVPIRLAPLEAPASLPTAARVALLALVAVGSVAFLLGPLGGPTPEREMPVEPVEAGTREEREAIYAAIHDLEHDYETGKLSEADYQTLRAELRTRAVALLRTEREKPEASVAPAELRCAACGTRGHPGDRFCAQCGARLEPAAEAGAPA